jgi:hypothetical protein
MSKVTCLCAIKQYYTCGHGQRARNLQECVSIVALPIVMLSQQATLHIILSVLQDHDIESFQLCGLNIILLYLVLRIDMWNLVSIPDPVRSRGPEGRLTSRISYEHFIGD